MLASTGYLLIDPRARRYSIGTRAVVSTASELGKDREGRSYPQVGSYRERRGRERS